MRDKVSAGAGALFLAAPAAAASGAFEVVKHSSTSWFAMVTFLIALTAVTFILVLLACGMREPLL